MLENLGFSQLRFVSAAGPWLRFSGHSRCRGSCQDQADDADAGSKPWLKVSRTTTCTQRLAPAPTLARPHLLLWQPGTRVFFSSSIVQLTGLFHLQLGVRAQLALPQRWPPETRWAIYPKTQTLSFLPSPLLSMSNQRLGVNEVGKGRREQAE